MRPHQSVTAPAAPSSLTATAVSGTEIDLSWTDNSANETGFKIEQSADGSTGWSQIDTVAQNVTSYHNTGLSAGDTWYYRVRAYNGVGNSPYSNTAHDTTDIAPDSLANLTLWEKANSLSLNNNDPVNSWPASSPATINFGDGVSPTFLTNQQNSLPGVQGNGSSMYLQSSINTGNPIDAETVQGDVATSEVQTITLAGGPDAGTWRATNSGTYDLAHNAAAGDVEADLDSLLGLAVSVSRSGGGTIADPYVYTVTWTLPGANSALVPQSNPADQLRRYNVQGSEIVSQAASTVLMVIIPPANSGVVNFFGWRGAGSYANDFAFYPFDASAGNQIVFVHGTALDNTGFIGAAPPAGWAGNAHVVTLRRGGSSATAGLIRSDGTDLINDPNAFTDGGAGLDVTTYSPMRILSDVDGNFCAGVLLERVVYKDAKTNSQLAGLANYLKHKYAL